MNGLKHHKKEDNNIANPIQPKQLDFSGQAFYIGIDVHKRSWKVTISNFD